MIGHWQWWFLLGFYLLSFFAIIFSFMLEMPQQIPHQTVWPWLLHDLLWSHQTGGCNKGFPEQTNHSNTGPEVDLLLEGTMVDRSTWYDPWRNNMVDRSTWYDPTMWWQSTVVCLYMQWSQLRPLQRMPFKIMNFNGQGHRPAVEITAGIQMPQWLPSIEESKEYTKASSKVIRTPNGEWYEPEATDQAHHSNNN
jgi:hypothetical protein